MTAEPASARWGGVPRFAVDGSITAAFLAMGQLELRFYDGSGYLGTAPLAIDTPLVAAMSLPLLWRRRAPITVLCLIGAAIGLPRLLVDSTIPFWGGLGPFAFALYSASRHARAPRDRLALLVPLVTVGLLSIEIRAFRVWSEYAFSAGVFGIAWLSGQALRRRQSVNDLLRGHLTDLAENTELRSNAALAQERARIARELHDVIAHNISVMVIQAGSARLKLRRDLDASQQALLAIESTGRQALDEMRRLLGVMRTDGEDTALAPPPGLGSLDPLVAQVRDAGLEVDMAVEGAPADLPPGLDLSAYRIVQEALTNALKHAACSQARVSIGYHPDWLDLSITNDIAATPRRRRAALDGLNGGRGLIGMRERATLFGGSLEAGPQPGGGFAVRARLPLNRKSP